MRQVSVAQAIELFESRPSTFVSLNYSTSQDKLNKGRGKGKTMEDVLGINPDNIVKTTIATTLIGTKVSYQTLVENRLGKESDLKGVETPEFESAGRTWGVRKNGVIVEHKGEIYVTAYFVSANIPKVSYTLDGKEIDLTDAKFDQFRKAEKAEGGRQVEAGVENVIVPRDINIGNINSFTIGGETYQIVK